MILAIIVVYLLVGLVISHLAQAEGWLETLLCVFAWPVVLIGRFED